MLLDVLLGFLILICIALGAVVLLQQSEGGALGLGGGPSGFMTSRGAGDLLTRTTWILAGIFFALCLGLTILQGRLHHGGSVVDRLRIDPLGADVLNTPRPAPAAAPGSTAAPGTAAPPTGFEAPAPQVNGATSGSTQFGPAAAPTNGAVTDPARERPATTNSIRAASTADKSSTASAPASTHAKP